MENNTQRAESHTAPCADKKNAAYAKEMLGNMSGIDSEMSAVCLYFYNHLVSAEHPGLSDAFRKISIDEMRHMDVFGTLAMQFGADPRLWRAVNERKHMYWSASHLKYTQKPRQMLSNALYQEYMTVDKYKRQMKTIQDETILENLRQIISEEQQHIITLKQLLQDWA